MITLILNPKTKTNLPGSNLNCEMTPGPQAYTFDEITGDLAQEICAVLESSKIEVEPIPGVAPEDFESAYCWFIS